MNRAMLTVLLIFCILIISVFSFQALLWPVSHFKSKSNISELHTIVNELTRNSHTDLEKTKAILEWFNISRDNIYNDYHLEIKGVVGIPLGNNFELYFGAPYLGIRTYDDHDALWVLTSEYGHCGEYGLLFREMANAADLNVTTVTCAGEDHVWNEVKIGNQWITVDATRVGSASDNGYNVSRNFMEEKVAGTRGTTQGNVSYVSAEFINGSIIDVTSRYSKTVNVTVTILSSEGKPLSNVEIIIHSNNRYFDRDTNKKGLITNQSGQCSFLIGGGDYFIQAKTNDLIPLFGRTHSIFSENTTAYNLTMEIIPDWTQNLYLVYFLFVLFLISIAIAFINRMRLYFRIIYTGKITAKHRREFIISSLSFLGVFLINLIKEGSYLIFIVSFFLFIIPVFCLLLSCVRFNNYLNSDYIRRRIKKSAVGILDGRINENQPSTNIPLPKPYIFSSEDWFNKLKEEQINVELIPVSKISNNYSVVINPFGATYLEEDIANLCTLKKVKKYINDGGIFINIGDLAFWRSWNSLRKIEGFTSPLVATYALDTHNSNLSLSSYLSTRSIVILDPVVGKETSLIDTWIYKQFGIRTSLGSPTPRIAQAYVDYLQSVDGTNITEFRSALNCEKEDTTMKPLIYSSIIEDKNEDGVSLHECYPVVAVHQQVGYLILFGLGFKEEQAQRNYDFIIRVIKLIHTQLSKKGGF